MTFSLFDHPHFKPLLARKNLAALFTAEAEIDAMLRFEAALAEAEAEADVIPEAAGRHQPSSRPWRFSRGMTRPLLQVSPATGWWCRHWSKKSEKTWRRCIGLICILARPVRM